MTEVFWTNRANDDIARIARFISNDSIIAAEKVIGEIFYCERFFQGEVVFEGPRFIDTNIKEFDFHYFVEGNYKIVYYRQIEKVFIVRVFDTRQNPSKLKL